jgi:serine/threonine protein kinase/Flp pilus assembly protein TadD
MSTASDLEQRFDSIALSCLEALDGSLRPTREELLARHPEFADRLAKFLDDQERVDGLAVPLRRVIQAPSVDDPNKPLFGEFTAPQELGDFRLLCQVGRGGMGVVYEAEQVSLGRRVALKVLPFAATMDPKQLQRFQNEARAAAQLHHTNIVPVYYVGCDKGVHFYAMQFIDGQSVAEIIAELRPGARSAASDQGDAAGVDAASGRMLPSVSSDTTPEIGKAGILSTVSSHPDRSFFRLVAQLGIQAAEALDHAHQVGIVHRDVKPANLLVDATGRLWVTDFGLAQVQGDSRLTLTGGLIGTLRYMSPEQALAKRGVIDHRTDVYSLGATLYELLTLEPVVGGSDRQELLRQIAFEEPRRPRRRNKALPAELETIVLKALQKNPADRYATAQELADDLERYLRHEPIRARRPSVTQRARKWARRHRPVVLTAALGLLAAAAVLAGSVGWVVRDRAARRTETERVVAAAFDESVSRQEERRLPEALSAARRANELLAGADVGEALQQRVRARLSDLELLGRLDNVRLEALIGSGDGDFDWNGADELYGQTFRPAGIDIGTLPVEEAGERLRKSTVAAELAAMLDHWALVRWRARGADDSSWRHLLQVARLADPDAWRARVRDSLERGDIRSLLAATSSEETMRLPVATLVVLGSALLGNKETYGQAEVFLREAQRRHADDFWLNFLCWEFVTSIPPPRPAERLRFAAVVAALRPTIPGARVNLGNVLHDAGRTDEAIAEYREALRLKKGYGLAHNGLGNALKAKGRTDEAIAEFQEALRLQPDNAAAHFNLAGALYDRRQFDEAIEQCRETIRLKKHLAEAHNTLGNALREKGRLGEAVAAYQEAIRIKKDHALAHYNMGIALATEGRLDDAITELGEAIQLKKDFADAHYNLGQAFQYKGRVDEAIAEYRETLRINKDFALAHNNYGMALMEKGRLDDAIAEYHETLRLKKDFAGGHNNLGNALKAKGRLEEAIAEYREAIRLKQDLAEAHYNLGNALYDREQFNEAIAELSEAVRLKPGLTVAAQSLRQAEQMVQLADRFPRVVEGKDRPKDAAERLAFAQLAQSAHRKQYAAAARLYGEAFAEQPALAADPSTGNRYNAACAAALASCGQSKDTDPSDDKECTRLRRQALDWLRADLDAWKKQLEKEPDEARPVVRQQMEYWQHDKDFAGIRGPESLSKLPEAERQEWQKLWQEVEALRQRSSESAKKTAK